MLSKEDARLAVKKGIHYLDATKPGWESFINLSELDLCSISFCVLGQLEGRYHTALEVLGLDQFTASEYGFDCLNADGEYDDADHDFDLLTETWKEALYERGL